MLGGQYHVYRKATGHLRCKIFIHNDERIRTLKLFFLVNYEDLGLLTIKRLRKS